MSKGYYYDEDESFYTESTPNDRLGSGSTLKNFMINGEVRITKGVERVRESIEDILSTVRGTVFFKPEYGSKLRTLQFEQNDFVVRDMAIEYVKQALEKNEPRITIVDVSAEIKDMEGTLSKKLIIYIKYKIKDTAMVDNYVYSMDR